MNDCADSDTIRWVANSIDDDEESSYTAFNDATDMNDPKYQVGIVFSSAMSFRNVVRN